eukprot:CCRYP_010961-RA/>CCRYP_010961-RA protein AED:0.21 eAED:0.20 QI:0/0/0/1/1/1/2/0/96
MKVGERGKCAANRNALTKTDGGRPYTPDGAVMNILANYAFDNNDVPSPKHGTVPFGLMLKFIPLIVGWGCDGSHAHEKALMPEDMSKVEVCPVTWD